MQNVIEAIQELAPNLDFRMENYDLKTLQSLNGVDLPSLKDIEAKSKVIEQEKMVKAEIKAAAKAALLERLGITADEATLLLS